jgi:hypothetical protein
MLQRTPDDGYTGRTHSFAVGACSDTAEVSDNRPGWSIRVIAAAPPDRPFRHRFTDVSLNIECGQC